MQEFESISASSYDPSALATKLTAKAADGWSVVAIVPTGGDVTAFVTREKSSDGETPKATDTSEPALPEEEASSFVVPAASEPAADTTPAPTPEAVSEPSGWAIAPEPPTPAAPNPEPASSQPAVTVQPGASYQPAATPSYEPAAPASTTPSIPSAAPTAASATPAAAAAPAVPAGWYADPAGRFELRYWDGSTWTEHVSRSGQQFTDPPVA
jgi:hypothetical protein